MKSAQDEQRARDRHKRVQARRDSAGRSRRRDAGRLRKLTPADRARKAERDARRGRKATQ